MTRAGWLMDTGSFIDRMTALIAECRASSQDDMTLPAVGISIAEFKTHAVSFDGHPVPFLGVVLEQVALHHIGVAAALVEDAALLDINDLVAGLGLVVYFDLPTLVQLEGLPRAIMVF